MNVEVIVQGLENNPQCFHGPCLLFRRNNKKSKEYFACSACRDRKECSFYLETTDKKVEKLNKLSKWIAIREKTVQNILAKNPYKRYLKMLKLLKSDNQHIKLACKNVLNTNQFCKNKKKSKVTRDKPVVSYCYTCEELFDNKETTIHKECNVLRNLTEHQLRHPTEILVPKEDAKTHAQYFFTKDTVKNLVLLLSRLQLKKVLCVGAPRIHEHLINECNTEFQSMLLDIDLKYYNFYNDKQFVWYNMFNNCVLKEDGLRNLEEFLQFDKIVVIMDPPFGGRVEPLAFTLNALNKIYCQVNRLDEELCEKRLFCQLGGGISRHEKLNVGRTKCPQSQVKSH